MAQDTETRQGHLLVILGPSGAGKDTLLSIAEQRLRGRSDVLFVRRLITRPAHDDSEPFLALGETAFQTALDQGGICFSWNANGLRYGLPRDMAQWLAAGKVAVVNGSRGALEDMRSAFGSVTAIGIHVHDNVLAGRLRMRGRESEAEITARIARATAFENAFEPDFVVDNSGDPETAGEQLAALIEALAPQPLS